MEAGRLRKSVALINWIIVASAIGLLTPLWVKAEQVRNNDAPEPNSQSALLSVQVNRAYAPEVTAAIAEVGKPTTRIIKQGDTFRSITISLCGHVNVTAVYAVAFAKENAISIEEVVALESGKEYRFPACLWNNQVSYEVQDREFPSQIYSELEIPFAGALIENPDGRIQSPISPGLIKVLSNANSPSVEKLAEGGRGFTAAEVARSFSELNPGLNSTELNKTSQSSIIVPEQRLSGVINVRESISTSDALSKIEAVIQTVAPPPSGTGLISEQGRASKNKAGHAEPAELISDIPYNGSCHWLNDTPISIDNLRNARNENAMLRRAKPREVTVLFLDTGYDSRLGEPAIKPSDLGLIGAYRDEDQIQLSGFNPLNPDNYNDATPPANLRSRMHGSEVVATFLGSRFLLGEDRAMNKAQVVFASMAIEDGLKAEGAAYALSHAAQNNIPIVNASFVANSENVLFLESLKRSNPALVLIAAAGNASGLSSTQFSSDDISWPGRLGARMADEHLPSVILSVGAHGPGKELLDFSRIGSDHVDLLAPGCNIPTYSLNDHGAIEKVSRSGTSYAAPIVSMIAAEMAREGMKSYQIRNRLVYSVDIDRSLDGAVRSSGTLNLRKALSIYRDIVEFTEEDPVTKTPKTRLISGTLETTQAGVMCEGVKIRYTQLLKFAQAGTRTIPNSSKRVYIWTRPSSIDGKLMDSKRCDLESLTNAPPLKILNADTNKHEDIALKDVVDFVARTYPPHK